MKRTWRGRWNGRRATALLAALPVSAAAGQPLVFTPETAYQFPGDQYPTCVAPADFNGDGYVDLVIGGRNVDGETAYLRGLSIGGFAPDAPVLTELQVDWVIARDFSYDGRLDLALAIRTQPAGVIIMHGNGDGSFVQTGHHFTGRSTSMLAADDLDGDGDLDLVATNYYTDNIAVLHNNGGGGFTVVQSLQLGLAQAEQIRPFYFAAGDLTDDGLTDVVVTQFSSNNLSFLEGAGGGLFSLPVTTPAGQAVSLQVNDIDRDGDNDIVTADLANFQGSVVVIPNAGGGQFGAPLTFPLGGWVWYITAGDFDGDGYDDLAVSQPISGDIRLLCNMGTGRIAFAPPQIISGGSFPRQMVARDLDGDCDIDIAIADIGSHRITILRNHTPQLGDCAAADFDHDGRISVTDLLGLLAAWGSDEPLFDFNLDGEIDVSDLLFLLGEWR